MKRNAGFSLVELIIVIAIMAILVGMVGMQVVPYIEKSRQSKDLQKLGSLCTSVLTAYGSNARELEADKAYSVSFTGTGLADTGISGYAATPVGVIDELKDLTNLRDINDLKKDLVSKASKDIVQVDMEYNGPNAIAIVRVQLTPASTYGRIFTPISAR